MLDHASVTVSDLARSAPFWDAVMAALGHRPVDLPGTPVRALALAATPPVAAQARDSTVSLTVSLDRPDWLYGRTDSPRFEVRLLRAGRAVPGARVVVALGAERMPPLRVDTVDASSGQATSLTASLPSPGFLRATASAVVDGATCRPAVFCGAGRPPRLSQMFIPRWW